MRAQFLISWKGKGTVANPYRPDLPPEVTQFVDQTNQDLSKGLPTKNFFVAEVLIEEKVIGRMTGSELWREGKENKPPTNAEKTSMRADLFAKLGFNPTKLDDLGLAPVDLGIPADERPIPATRKQITDRLIAELKNDSTG